MDEERLLQSRLEQYREELNKQDERAFHEDNLFRGIKYGILFSLPMYAIIIAGIAFLLR